jgi:hypothetical protein
MNKTKKYVTSLALLAGTTAFWGCKPEKTEVLSNRLPQDVCISCVLDSSDFSNWFAGDSVTENGIVTPANSVGFVSDTNCNFYRWAEQMFLWVTSPVTSGKYVAGNTVMESPVFYTVQPDTTNNGSQNRVLVQNLAGDTLRAVPQMKKSGPNRLPVVFGKDNKMYEVETPGTANGMVSVKNAGNKVVPVHHVEKGSDGTYTFFDGKNQPIEKPTAMITHTHHKERILHSFATTTGGNISLDMFGNLIETETGQATQDVLVAKNGSVVYYILFVNDVYAYYQSGALNGALSRDSFPTTPAGQSAVCNYARSFGATLPDSNALAMELKTSWVEAIDLPNPESYIYTYAIVPVYKKVQGQAWVLSGSRLAKLALLGAHVVGSVAHHPEMVWATFEHQDNASNAAYQYLDTKRNVKTVPQDTGKNWVLSADASYTNFNFSHQHWSNAGGDTIYGATDALTPSNILRTMPWGSAMDSATNGEDKSSAASNSEIISINNQVYNMLKGNDVRKNYQLIGATWTFGGAAPNGSSYGYQTENGVAIGTNVCANSTMETFFQSPSQSCFTCHSNNNSLKPDSLSHIFSNIIPIKLATAPKSLKK